MTLMPNKGNRYILPIIGSISLISSYWLLSINNKARNLIIGIVLIVGIIQIIGLEIVSFSPKRKPA